MVNTSALQPIVTAIGFTVWQLQVLESILVHHITLLHDVPPGVTQAEMDAALDGRYSLTFGQLLKIFEQMPEQHRTLDALMVRRLGWVKVERNWLVHRSQRDSYATANLANSASEILSRITALHSEATDLLKAVQAATEAVLVARGASMDRINRDAARIGKAWVRGERHPDELRSD